MTTAEFLGHVRARIGSPKKSEVSDLALLDFANQALIQMGDELRFRVVTEDHTLALVADQAEYQMPSDVLSILWVEHGGRRLEPFGLGAEDRDLHDWRGQPSSTPTQFAVRGRKLIVHPAPDSGAVSEDAHFSWSFVGAPAEIGDGGPVGLSDSDHWLHVYWTALEYCLANPSEMNQVRGQGLMATKETMCARARERWVGEGTSAAKHQVPRLIPRTGRTGGAR